MQIDYIAPTLVLCVFGPVVFSFDDLYVDTASPSCPVGAGTLGSPFCTVTEALAAATSGDRVHIAPGTYVENLIVNEDVTLVGTGGDPVTILDGGGVGRVLSIPSDRAVNIEGVTITNGAATSGAGIEVLGSLTISNSTIAGNTAISSNPGLPSGGGGIWINDGGLAMLDCTVESNSTNALGGGIYADRAVLEILRSTVRGNTGSGIGVVDRSDLFIAASTISGNAGAGIDSNYSSFVVANSTISGNSGNGIGAKGDIVNHMYVFGSTITENSGWGFHVDYYVNFLTYTGDASGSVFTGNGASTYYVDDWGGNVFSGPSGLGPLQDNGGPTETHLPLPGSSAIGATMSSVGGFDQRGFPSDSLRDAGAVDAGAVNPNVCNGDGGDQTGCTDCPCGNNASPGTVGGCLNSANRSGRLLAGGARSVGPNALTFHATGLTPNSFAILASGTDVAPQNLGNTCVGTQSGLNAPTLSGLRCAIFDMDRFGSRPTSELGDIIDVGWGGFEPPVAGLIGQGGYMAGDTRYFQLFYRELPHASCQNGVNTTQAIAVTFLP